MSVHPKLMRFSKAKHIKAFNKYLKGIEEDLKKLGSRDFEAEIISFGSPESFLQRMGSALLARGFGDPEEALIVTTGLHGCPVEIAVPMGKGGVALPYLISVELSIPMAGRAEYRRGTIGNKWHLEPNDKRRSADLKRSLPKVKMKQEQASKAREYLVEVGYALEPTVGGKTEWRIHSGYEGTVLSGGYRPRVLKYLEAIPAVATMLRKWNGG